MRLLSLICIFFSCFNALALSQECEDLYSKRFEIFQHYERNSEDVHEFEVLYGLAKDDSTLMGLDASKLVNFFNKEEMIKTISLLSHSARGDYSYDYALKNLEKMRHDIKLNWSVFESSASLGQVAVYKLGLILRIVEAKDKVLSRMLDDYDQRVADKCE